MSVKRLFNARQQFFDTNGDPLNGGQLFVYAAGSSTKVNTYNSSTGLNANTDPLILDNSGRLQAEVWVTSGVMLKLVLATSGDTDPPTTPIWTEDNISGINDTTVTLDQWISGPAPTYVSTTSFTLVGDQTANFEIGRKLKTTNSGGTKYGHIKNSVYAVLTTVTIDDDVLDSGLSSVSYGLPTATNNSLPATIRATISGNTTLAEATDFPSIKNITATATVTLPVGARVAPGKPIRLKSSTTGSVLIAPNGTDTIDGVNANIRVPSFECVELESDGTSAWILTRKSQWAVGDWKWGGYSTADIGWVKGGQAVSRTTYANLFALYSTTFGVGDGSTTFDLPDHRGRGLIGAGTGNSTDSGVNADVDTTGDTLTVPTNNNKWETGMAVVFTLASGTITGLVSTTTYYVVRGSATTVQLASTLANAQNGIVIDLTAKSSPVWSIVHTLTARTLAEKGGKESKAMTSTEDLAHTHGIQSKGNTGGATTAQGTAGGGAPVTLDAIATSTGGNAAMPVMNPFLVGELYIKT